MPTEARHFVKAVLLKSVSNFLNLIYAIFSSSSFFFLSLSRTSTPLPSPTFPPLSLYPTCFSLPFFLLFSFVSLSPRSFLSRLFTFSSISQFHCILSLFLHLTLFFFAFSFPFHILFTFSLSFLQCHFGTFYLVLTFLIFYVFSFSSFCSYLSFLLNFVFFFILPWIHLTSFRSLFFSYTRFPPITSFFRYLFLSLFLS